MLDSTDITMEMFGITVAYQPSNPSSRASLQSDLATSGLKYVWVIAITENNEYQFAPPPPNPTPPPTHTRNTTDAFT